MKADKKLKNVMDVMLEKEIKDIPAEEEIENCHIFSESFKLSIRRMIHQEEQEKKKLPRYVIRFFEAAACFVLFICVGTLLCIYTLEFGSKKSAPGEDTTSFQTESSDSVKEAESIKETAEDTTAETTEEATGDIAVDSAEHKEDYWQVRSISYDGKYQVEVLLNNTGKETITYSPVYHWCYMLNGKSTESQVDYSGQEAVTLQPGESLTEKYDLSAYGINEGGGIFEFSREINGEENTLTFDIK